MAADIESCLTEVRCTTTSGYGTGYLIAPDLVLTAAHVIAESLAAPLPAPLKIETRTLAQFNAGLPFQQATLFWPPAEQWQQLAPLDIALIQITSDTLTRAAAQVVQLGRGDLAQDQVLQIMFAGFPRLMTIGDSAARDVKQIFGEAAPLSGAKQNLFEITIKAKQPQSDDTWKGVSGAAVFAQERIIAVLNVKLSPGALVDFNAARLDAAMRDQAFRDRVAIAQAAISTKPGNAVPLNLGRLVCLVDRDLQETAFRNTFRELLAEKRARPLCCLIYGGARHRPLDLAERFSLVTIPELRKLKIGEALPYRPISWPAGGELAANLATLRALFWNALCGEEGSEAPTDPAAFASLLSDDSRPHLFVTELGATQLDADSAALWSAWLSFLDSIAACELTRPPLHIFLASDVTRAQIDAWLKEVAPAKATMRHALDELSACKWVDFGEWIDRRVPKIVPALAGAAAELRDDLEDALDEMLGGPKEFTASDLRQIVRKMVKKGR